MNNAILNENVIPMKPVVTNKSVRGWVSNWLANRFATFNYKTNSISIDGVDMDTQRILRSINLDWNEDNSVAHNHNRSLIADALNEWLDSERDAFLSNFKHAFKYEAPKEDLARKLIKALTGKESELDIAVLKHFIWQVRAKMFNYEVKHHLMPILFGEQGCGKSYAIAKMLNIIDAFVTKPTALTELTDSRSQARFNKYFICFIDEMGGASKADSAIIKSVITKNEVDWRPMGTNSDMQKINNCTFLGASNLHIMDVIRDTTGARRFYEIECVATDHNTINTLDYAALWCSVDESKPSPIMPYLKQLQEVQAEMVPDDMVTEWVSKQMSTGISKSDCKDWPSASELYKAFRDDVGDYGAQLPSQMLFSLKLKKLIGDDRCGKYGSARYDIKVKGGWFK